MNTPITDAVETKRMDADIPVIFGTVPSHVARRLETDRSALMEALEQTLAAWEEGYKTTECNEPESARQTLAAARANFPEA